MRAAAVVFVAALLFVASSCVSGQPVQEWYYRNTATCGANRTSLHIRNFRVGCQYYTNPVTGDANYVKFVNTSASQISWSFYSSTNTICSGSALVVLVRPPQQLVHIYLSSSGTLTEGVCAYDILNTAHSRRLYYSSASAVFSAVVSVALVVLCVLSTF